MNANEGACGFAATQGTVEEPHGGHTSHFAEHPSIRAETTPRAFCSMHAAQVEHYRTMCTVFCACRSQNNRINYGASATHSLCFLAVFMLAMLFGSQHVLASVYPSAHKRSRH